MQTVILKNGAEEGLALVNATMLSIRQLVERYPIYLFELVYKCRDANHRFFGNAGEELMRLSLVRSDGSIHESVRNIVLSAVSGEGFNMTLGSPIKL